MQGRNFPIGDNPTTATLSERTYAGDGFMACLAANLRSRGNAALVRVFVELDGYLQRIPERVVETNTVHTLSGLC